MSTTPTTLELVIGGTPQVAAARDLFRELSEYAAKAREASQGIGTGMGGGGGGTAFLPGPAGSFPLSPTQPVRPVSDRAASWDPPPGSAAAVQQFHMENWSMRQAEMATERMLHPAYQARVERDHDRAMRDLDRPQWQRDLLGAVGGPMGRMGAIAGGAYLLHQQMGNWSQAAGTYWQQEAVAAAGVNSGDLGTAMGASVQAAYGRERAVTSAQWGAASGAGGAAMLIGGLAGGPVGIGVAIAGALISAASEFGSKAADAMLAKAQAQEQAAAQSFASFVGARRRFAGSAAEALAFGRTLPSDNDIYNPDVAGPNGLSWRYGYGSQEIMDREARFARGGGQGLTTEFLLAAERGWGVGADQQAAFTRSVSPGQGAGVLRTGGTEQYTRTLISDAIKLGMDTARIPDYLQRIGALNAQFVERGITIDAASLAGVVTGMQSGGLSPWAATAATQNMQGYGGNLLSQMAGMRVPQGATQAIVMRALMQRFGGFDESMKGLEGLLSSGEFPDFLRGAAGSMGMPGGISSAIMMQLTGLGPSAAEKALRAGRATGLGGETEEQAARRAMARPDAMLLQADAMGTAMQNASIATMGFAEVARLATDLIQAQINNMQKNAAPAIEKTLAELGGGEGPLSQAYYQRARDFMGKAGMPASWMPLTLTDARRKPGKRPVLDPNLGEWGPG